MKLPKVHLPFTVVMLLMLAILVLSLVQQTQLNRIEENLGFAINTMPKEVSVVVKEEVIEATEEAKPSPSPKSAKRAVVSSPEPVKE